MIPVRIPTGYRKTAADAVECAEWTFRSDVVPGMSERREGRTFYAADRRMAALR